MRMVRIAKLVLLSIVLIGSPMVGQEFVPGEMIIQFAQQPERQTLQEVERVLGTEVTWQKLQHAKHAKGMPNQPHPLSFVRIASFDEKTEVEPLCDKVVALDGVSLASVNRMPMPTFTPNDPIFNTQFNHQLIDSEDAWDISLGSTDIVIGLIETGCRVTHEDLEPHIWINDDPINGVDDDNNGLVDDMFGWNFARNNRLVNEFCLHGTQVAGIAAAKIDNGLGVAGVSNATILVAKWFHQSGDDCSVAESVFYAVDNGAHVLNMSLGCPDPLPLTEMAVNFAHANGVVVVAASGNAGNFGVDFPAAYPVAIAVGATDFNDEVRDFSNTGPNLDVVAPSDVPSTRGTNDSQYDPSFNGTSSATPHVAGLVALMLSVNPSLTPEEIRTAIRENADDLGAEGFDNVFGAGRINVGATIQAISVLLGDVNRDGSVDLLDVQPFVDLLSSNQFQAEADVNQDGVVDLLDIGGFVDLLGG